MPRSFRGYQVLEKLGAGGMSTLYVAVQTALDRKVAIKILHPSLAEDQSFIARFEREARAASSLGHNNIVTVIDFGIEDDVYFIVMEYLEGIDLRGVLQQISPLPPEIALLILEEIAYGLQAAHAKGVIHRDVKPSNVILGNDGVVKILDFGLARQRSDIDRLSALTVPGSVLGTPAYMSPEQATAHEVDHRTDIFSLGACAYELLSGRRPFRGDSYSEIKEKVIGKAAPSLAGELPLITPQIQRLVDRMLEKDPAKRPADMGVVLREIEGAIESLDSPESVLKYRRKYLTAFAADPQGFAKELETNRLKYHLERGQYFMSLGLDQIDDAVSQFRLVLSLDPNNRKASDALRLLRKRKEDSGVRPPSGDKTIQVDATQIAETAITPPPQPAAGPATAPREKRGAPWKIIGAAVALILVALVGRQFLPAGKSAGRVGQTRVPVAAAGNDAADAERADRGQPADTVAVAAPAASAASDTVGTAPPDSSASIETASLEAADEPPPAAPPAAREEETRTPPAEARRQPAPGFLKLSSRPEGASVSVRRPSASSFRSTGERTSCTLRLDPGRWVVRLQKDGYEALLATVQVDEGVTREDRLTLAPLRGGEGHILVILSPFADVHLDGRLIDRQQRRVLIPVSAGEPHKVEARHPSFGTHDWPGVIVDRGDTLVLRHNFRK